MIRREFNCAMVVRMSREMIDKLALISKETGLSASSLVRHAVDHTDFTKIPVRMAKMSVPHDGNGSSV